MSFFKALAQKIKNRLRYEWWMFARAAEGLSGDLIADTVETKDDVIFILYTGESITFRELMYRAADLAGVDRQYLVFRKKGSMMGAYIRDDVNLYKMTRFLDAIGA